MANTNESLWPSGVYKVTFLQNPEDYRFRFVEVGQGCTCSNEFTNCIHGKCDNVSAGFYCTGKNCSFGEQEDCGNRLTEFPGLQLFNGRFGLHVRTTREIPKGHIVAPYWGFLTTEDGSNPLLKKRYLLMVKSFGYKPAPIEGDKKTRRKPKAKKGGNLRLHIDAEYCGNISRFFNHSCDAYCVFSERRYKRRMAMVVIATQTIPAGKEITVDYGKDFGFKCGCGHCAA